MDQRVVLVTIDKSREVNLTVSRRLSNGPWISHDYKVSGHNMDQLMRALYTLPHGKVYVGYKFSLVWEQRRVGDEWV